MLVLAALMLGTHLQKVPASLPFPSAPCIAPTLEDARAHMPVAVQATLTGRSAEGTLIADQLLEQRACRQRLNMILRGPRPDFDHLRALFEEAMKKSEGRHIFVVIVTLSGKVAEAASVPEREGPADVSLDIVGTSDARIVEVYLH
jgi:hypothetical protein